MIQKNSPKLTLILLMLSVILVVSVTTYRFLIKKDYSFLVEAECDPEITSCFYRDCTNPDDCPPNGLSNYSIFKIKAYDFEKCSDDSCYKECVTGVIDCEEIQCGELEEDECSGPEENKNFNVEQNNSDL